MIIWRKVTDPLEDELDMGWLVFDRSSIYA